MGSPFAASKWERKSTPHTHLFGDREFIRAGVACPFVVPCFSGDDEDVGACGAEQHGQESTFKPRRKAEIQILGMR